MTLQFWRADIFNIFFQGWKLASFVLGLVFSQSLASIVVVANLMLYLMDVQDEPLPVAAATANITTGIAAIMSIWGSCLTDAYIGRYQMLLCSTIVYITGLSLLTVAASPLHSKKQIITFRTGLLLIAMGKAGHFPTIKDFGADQLKSNEEDDEDPKVKKRLTFWWWTGVNLGAFAGIILLAIAEGSRHWELVYGLLAITMSFSLCMFISSKSLYRYVEPCGSVLNRVLHVFMASFFNKHLDSSPNTITVIQVEETKLLIRMIPMWTTFLLYGLVKSLGNTFFLQQGSNMNRELNHAKIPLPLFLLFTRYVSGQVIWIVKRLFKEFPTSRQVLNPTRRIGIGMVFGVLCCTIATIVEARRINMVKEYSLEGTPKEKLRMSVFWLTPQFLLLGAMDGFTYPGIKEFFYDQVPKSMWSFGPSFTASVIGMGSLISVVVIAAADKASSRGGRPSWFAETINNSRLDYFYLTVTVLGYFNLIFYGLVASKYKYMAAEKENKPDNDMPDTISL